MKAPVTAIAVCLAAALFCSCSSKAADKTENISETAAAEISSSEESLPEEGFEKLPDGAENELSAVSDAAHSAFPETKGKKMFGFKGMEELELDTGKTDCYIFDYYTYSAKNYIKIATLAKSAADESVFMLDDSTGEYHLCNSAAEEEADN